MSKDMSAGKTVADVKTDGSKKWYLIQEEEDAKTAAEAKATATSVPNQLMTLKKALGNLRGGKGLKPIRTKLGYHFGVSGVAGVAFTTVQNLNPGAASGFNSFAAVYDEVRVRGIRVGFKTYLIAGAPAGAGLDAHGVLAFDPATSGALGSIAEAMEFAHHTEPIGVTCFGGQAPFPGRVEWAYLNAKTSVPIIESGITADLVGGGWFPCSNSSSAIIGYLKPYVEVGGGAVQFRVSYIVYFDVEFRVRG
jgi:hypothetical protein